MESPAITTRDKKNTTPPIYITGSNRSGSTWLASLLNLSKSFRWIEEPFNPEMSQSSFAYHLRPPPFDGHFHYVLPRQREQLAQYLRHRLGLGYPFMADFRQAPGPRRLIGALMRSWQFEYTGSRRLLIKDPLGLFSLDSIRLLLKPTVLITVRHPAAYVSSIQRLGWRVGTNLVKNQPELHARFPANIQETIHRLLHVDPEERDVVAQASLMWNMCHAWIGEQQRQYPRTIVLRYEDLAYDATTEVPKLYQRLGLHCDDAIQNEIERRCGRENPTEAPAGSANIIVRNSREVAGIWRQRLDSSTITRIRRLTADYWHRFYRDEDWTA